MTGPSGTSGTEPLRIGIRQFVEQAMQQGDLRHTLEPGPSALEGLRAHQRMQKKREAGVEAEFRLLHRRAFVIDECPVSLEFSGRIDLLYPEHLPPIVEEIKSTYILPEPSAEDEKGLHWAQAKLYAWCYAEVNGLESVGVRTTWVRVDDGKTFSEEALYRREELYAWLLPAVEGYLRWVRQVAQRHERMVHSAALLNFPYGVFRPGQRALAAEVYRALRDRTTLLAEAPTGIGKTMSVLFPAVKALGEGQVDKILYLTAKRTGREVALDAVAKMCQDGLQASVLELRAKQQTCACLSGRLTAEDTAGCEACPHTLGFFDRLPAAMLALWSEAVMDASAVERVADAHRVCAFELSLRMIPWSAVVIGDYNYLYDPLVRLSYFDETSDRVVALVDEAHNLPDRARSMYSGALSEQSLAPVLGGVRASPIKRAVRSLQRKMEAASRERSAEGVPQTLVRACEKVVQAAADASASFQSLRAEGGVDGAMTEMLKMLFRFMKIAELYSDRHCRLHHDRPVSIELACLNAQNWLSKWNGQLSASVFFSATLRPGTFYQRELGLEAPRELSLASPFPPENQAVLIVPWVDTRFQYRDQYLNHLSALIQQVFLARPGKYLVFFSSYAYMAQVYADFIDQNPELPSCLQEPNMDEAARQGFLDQFFVSEAPMIGFVISGGIFAEGVDFKGDALHGAICVGPALPHTDELKKRIQDDYERQGEEAFLCACVYPGFTRVQQSAGRVIRSESDKGVILLVDRRFTTPLYRSLYPPYWQPRLMRDPDALVEVLKRFWEEVPTG